MPKAAAFAASIALDALGADQRTPAGDFLREVAGEFLRRPRRRRDAGLRELVADIRVAERGIQGGAEPGDHRGWGERRRQDTGPLVGNGSAKPCSTKVGTSGKMSERSWTSPRAP